MSTDQREKPKEEVQAKTALIKDAKLQELKQALSNEHQKSKLQRFNYSNSQEDIRINDSPQFSPLNIKGENIQIEMRLDQPDLYTNTSAEESSNIKQLNSREVKVNSDQKDSHSEKENQKNFAEIRTKNPLSSSSKENKNLDFYNRTFEKELNSTEKRQTCSNKELLEEDEKIEDTPHRYEVHDKLNMVVDRRKEFSSPSKLSNSLWIEIEQSIKKIEAKLNETISHSDLVNLTKEWNTFVNAGGRITIEMWKIYNSIQEKFNKPLVLYKENDEINAYKLSASGKLYSKLQKALFNQRLTNPSKQISKLFDHWLIQRGEKEGIKPFFEIAVKNPYNNKSEVYWIPNAKQRTWSPYPGKEQQFYYGPRSAGTMITSFLTTKIKLDQDNFMLYKDIETKLIEKYPRIKRNNNQPLFRVFYKLNFPNEVIDEAIKLVFWKYVNSRPKSYIEKFSLKISELMQYCEENKIVSRKNIQQFAIFAPSIASRDNIISELDKSIDERLNSEKNNIKSTEVEFKSIKLNKKIFISSRPIAKDMLTTLQKIEANFGLNDLTSLYKPPKDLIIAYKRYKNKLLIQAESENDKALESFLLDGIGLSTKSDIRKGVYWLGKIKYPSKGRHKNEWYRFSSFISSSCERKIANHDNWFPSKHAGGKKTVRRRIYIEINPEKLRYFKIKLLNNVIALANHSSHRKWVSQSRADARRNRNPENASKRIEQSIIWWNGFRTKLIIDSENYQNQALLHVANIRKSAIRCLADMFENDKITNIEFNKISEKVEENSERIELTDCIKGKKLILNDIFPIEENTRNRSLIDVFHEDYGANIAFKSQLVFFSRYNPIQSPLVRYLGLEPEEISNSTVELHWSDRRGYPSTGMSMADTFAPDIVIRNHLDQIIAVIQLKGYSQTKASVQPNSSIFQILELMKYYKNPQIKTALVSVKQIENYILYEWLVPDLEEAIEVKQNGGKKEKFWELGGGYEKHPELDPLIPRNLRKREFLEKIYEEVSDTKTIYNVNNLFDQIRENILTSEINFYQFIGHKKVNAIAKCVIQNYLDSMREKLQMVVNQVNKSDRVNSCVRFRYYWSKEVVLDYYEKLKEFLEQP